MIDHDLRPSHETQRTENGRLNQQGDGKVLHDRIHAERDRRDSPQHHHQRRQAFCVFQLIIEVDLRQ